MTIITTGVKTPNNTVVARKDLRDFTKDEPLINLYLLALQRLQQVDQTETLSWFRLSGIHGRPYIPFDDVNGVGTFGGYCTHSSILFPTWHRPYLALYEQTMYKLVNDIANEFTDRAQKDKYIQAALRFRIPYWDWASDAYLPDIAATQENVKVTTPNGVRTIRNPLYAYTFHPLYSDFGDGLPDERMWESWQSTLRYPSTNDASAQSRPRSMERLLQNNRLTIRDRTYNLLTQATRYEAFSNDGFLGPQSDPRWYDSLESIHGQIHGLVGGNGHMGVVDYAAFDPVFWLHHANVDRLFAIWQGLNPNSYVVPRPNQAGTFTTRPGTIENAESPLEPFWQTADKFWDSNTVRDPTVMYYTYPELEAVAGLPQQQKIPNLRRIINRLYGSTAPVAAVQPKIAGDAATAADQAPAATASAIAPTSAASAAASQAVSATAPSVASATAPQVAAAASFSAASAKAPPSANAPAPQAASAQSVAHVEPEADIEITGVDPGDSSQKPIEGDDGKIRYHEWVANIRAEKYAAKSTFFIHIFMGDFNSDPAKWGEDPNLVGSHVIFANNADFTGCERCIASNEANKLVTGTIPLTGALGDKLGTDKLGQLTPALVVSFLKQYLHWRIQKHDGTPIERNDVPGLKVSVGHSLVEIPATDEDFPVWGEMKLSLGVTAGRPGGAEDDD